MYSQMTEVTVPRLTSALLFYFHIFLLKQCKKGQPESYYVPSDFYCNIQGTMELYFPSSLGMCRYSCIVNILSISILTLLFQKPIIKICLHHVETFIVDEQFLHTYKVHSVPLKFCVFSFHHRFLNSIWLNKFSRGCFTCFFGYPMAYVTAARYSNFVFLLTPPFSFLVGCKQLLLAFNIEYISQAM